MTGLTINVPNQRTTIPGTVVDESKTLKGHTTMTMVDIPITTGLILSTSRNTRTILNTRADFDVINDLPLQMILDQMTTILTTEPTTIPRPLPCPQGVGTPSTVKMQDIHPDGDRRCKTTGPSTESLKMLPMGTTTPIPTMYMNKPRPTTPDETCNPKTIIEMANMICPHLLVLQ
jgi:hypothetical protein